MKIYNNMLDVGPPRAASLADLLHTAAHKPVVFEVGGREHRVPMVLGRFLCKNRINPQGETRVPLAVKDEKNLFPMFLAFAAGEEVESTLERVYFFAEVARQLENERIVAALENVLARDYPTDENTIFDKLVLVGALDIDSPADIEYAVTYWSQVKDNDRLLEVPLNVLHKIFRHGGFRSDRDSVLATVLKIVKKRGPEYNSLFGYCECKRLEQAIELINLVSYDEIHPDVVPVLVNLATTSWKKPAKKQPMQSTAPLPEIPPMEFGSFVFGEPPPPAPEPDAQPEVVPEPQPEPQARTAPKQQETKRKQQQAQKQQPEPQAPSMQMDLPPPRAALIGFPDEVPFPPAQTSFEMPMLPTFPGYGNMQMYPPVWDTPFQPFDAESYGGQPGYPIEPPPPNKTQVKKGPPPQREEFRYSPPSRVPPQRRPGADGSGAYVPPERPTGPYVLAARRPGADGSGAYVPPEQHPPASAVRVSQIRQVPVSEPLRRQVPAHEPQKRQAPPAPAPQCQEIKWFQMWDDWPDYQVNGVFCHLQREYDSVHRFVDIAGGGVKAKFLVNLLDLDPDHLFRSYWDSFGPKGHSPNNTWVRFHLKLHKLIPTHYTLATTYVIPNNSSPKSWKLFGSLDGESWMLLDEQKGVSALDAAKKENHCVLRTFPVRSGKGHAYTWFKLVQTQNWAKNGAPNEHELRLNGFELYGQLYELQ